MGEVLEEMRAAASRIIAEAGAHQAVAAHLKATLGWGCSDRTAVARLSQMLSPSDRHQLPAEALPIIVLVTGRDPFSEVLADARFQHRQMTKVQPGEGVGQRRRVG